VLRLRRQCQTQQAQARLRNERNERKVRKNSVIQNR
jgi:hypothetical protein